MDHEISDIAVVDFDNDGMDEIAVINGFHGNEVAVYKQSPEGWEKIYSCPIAFGHALWGGMLMGKNRLLIGDRREGNELLCLTPGSGGVEKTVIGTGGPSQFTVWNQGEKGMILSADREVGEAVLYTLS